MGLSVSAVRVISGILRPTNAKNVHQDTLDPTVQHNVLILRTDSHARDFVTVAMTYAICLGVV